MAEPLKRYLLFAGYRHYPAGGWSDFKGSFDAPDQAADFLGGQTFHYDWSHIVDSQTGETI